MFLRQKKSGVALIIILWVLVFLDIIVVQFALSMRSEADITMNYRDNLTAYYYAYGAMEVAKYELMFVATQTNTHGKDPNTGATDLRPDERDGTNPGWTDRKIEMDRGDAVIDISGKESKLDINFLLRRQEKLEELLEKCGIEPMSSEMSMIARSIIDWTDKDDTYSVPGVGAEDDWYEDNEHPGGLRYECKDDRFYSVEELELIRGLRPEVGDDEEEIKRKQALLDCLYDYLEADPIKISTNINENISSYQITEFVKGEDEAQEIMDKRAEDGYATKGKKIVFFEVTTTGNIKGSPVKAQIKAEFQNSGRQRIKLLSWIDNYVPLSESDYMDANTFSDLDEF